MMDESKKEGVPIEALMTRIASMDDARLTAELQAEFNSIIVQTPGFDHFRLNPAKNRYNGNIYLYDHTRVVLNDYPNGDYIHASYVNTPRQHKRFILTQAPLPETINDFWFMVAQVQVQVIVAICQFDDPDSPASDDPFPLYWPRTKGETLTFGRVQILCGEVRGSAAMTVTKLKWNRINQQPPRNLVHLHLHVAGWEPNGLPTPQLLEFLDALWEREPEMMKANGHSGLPPPIIVHCGSGTARSGQFTALAIATEAARRGWPFSIKDIICTLQGQRYGVLREPTQVMALCYAIIEYAKQHKILPDEVEGLKKVMHLMRDRLSDG